MARKKVNTKPRKSEQQLAIEALYKDVREKFTSHINSAKKLGYIFPENYVPPIPKRIKEGSINRLLKLDAQRYDKAVYKTASGQIISGKAGQALRRREGAKKQSETKRAKYNERREKSPISPTTSYYNEPSYTYDDYVEDGDYDYSWHEPEPEPEPNIVLDEDNQYVDTESGNVYGSVDTIKEMPSGQLVDITTGEIIGEYGDEGDAGLFDQTIIDNFLDEMTRAGDAFGTVFDDFIEWSKGEYGEHATSKMIQQAAYGGDLPSPAQRYALEATMAFIESFTNKYLSNDTFWGARSDFASRIRSLGKYNEYNQMFDQQRSDYRNKRRAARNARRRNK